MVGHGWWTAHLSRWWLASVAVDLLTHHLEAKAEKTQAGNGVEAAGPDGWHQRKTATARRKAVPLL